MYIAPLGVPLANPWLAGNGETCPGCGLRASAQIAAAAFAAPLERVPCNFCSAGLGRVALPKAEIIRRTLAENQALQPPRVRAQLQSGGM